MVTEQEARDMKAAIQAFEKKDSDAQRAIHDAEMATAQSWFDGLRIKTPTTRDEALGNFNTIEQLSRTETDRYRKSILRNELQKANEKYKEVKRNGS